MRGEFPKGLALVRSIASTPSKLSSERARFNNESSYPFISLGYSPEGFPISRNRAMTLSDCRRRCFHYRKLDPRFFSEEEMLWFDARLEDNDEWYSKCIYPPAELRSKFGFGSVRFGVTDADPVQIAILELDWMK